jgi:hypothetical protein
MQIFRTTLEIPEFPFQIGYDSKSLFIGSCFTENIGNYLKELRFDVLTNPFGIIYNPVSIVNSIKYLTDKKIFLKEELNLYNDLWFSFHHHGRFSDSDKDTCLDKINSCVHEASEFIQKADFLFLTFGTAFIYTHKQTKTVVANCHKLPSDTFVKSILSPEDIIQQYISAFRDILKINTRLKIIFTVSPIRHWNDGASENQLSKSVLFVAINEIIKKCSNCFYFPAYELVMDDLRDYRFYAEDMIHLNGTAIDYVRGKFARSMIAKEAQEIMEEVRKLIQAKNHKPFNPDTKAHKSFKEACHRQTHALKKKFPFLNLAEFEEYFK